MSVPEEKSPDSLLSLIGGLVGDEQPAAPAPSTNTNDLLMDLLGLDSSPAEPSIPPVTAVNKQGILVTFNLTRDAENKLRILAESRNNTSLPIADYLFQAAVPKSIQINLSPANSSVIAPNGTVQQEILINNPAKTTLKMRVKISYSSGGVPAPEIQETVGQFPVSY